MEILTTILVAALSGLTILAYKHPDSYAKLFKFMSAIYWLLMASVSVWNYSAQTVHQTLLPFIQSDKRPAALKAMDAVTLNESMFWLILGIIGIYIVFLWSFPIWLTKSDKPQPQQG